MEDKQMLEDQLGIVSSDSRLIMEVGDNKTEKSNSCKKYLELNQPNLLMYSAFGGYKEEGDGFLQNWIDCGAFH